MNIKENHRHKKHKEDKVEDIYGVHFKYKDLFSRLLKVQKEQQISEEKALMPRVKSFESVKLRQLSGGRPKKEVQVKKSATSGQKAERRSISVRKIVMRQPTSERKRDAFKSFSPSQKKPKKMPHKAKKHEKKASSTAKIPKKVLEKANL